MTCPILGANSSTCENPKSYNKTLKNRNLTNAMFLKREVLQTSCGVREIRAVSARRGTSRGSREEDPAVMAVDKLRRRWSTCGSFRLQLKLGRSWFLGNRQQDTSFTRSKALLPILCFTLCSSVLSFQSIYGTMGHLGFNVLKHNPVCLLTRPDPVEGAMTVLSLPPLLL